MSEFWIGFLIGGFFLGSVGATLGMLVAGLCMTAAARPLAPLSVAANDESQEKVA